MAYPLPVQALAAAALARATTQGRQPGLVAQASSCAALAWVSLRTVAIIAIAKWTHRVGLSSSEHVAADALCPQSQVVKSAPLPGILAQVDGQIQLAGVDCRLCPGSDRMRSSALGPRSTLLSKEHRLARLGTVCTWQWGGTLPCELFRPLCFRL
jgi:hypothetical protein